MKKSFFMIVLAALFFISCGENSSANDNDSASNDTLALTDADSATPVEQDFFASDADNFASLDFKGIINTQTDYEESKATNGIGTINMNFGSSTVAITQYLYAIKNKMPDDYPKEKYRGLEYIGVTAYNIDTVSSTDYHYNLAGFGMPIEFLQGLKESGTNESVFPELSWLTYYDINLRLRKDNSTVSRHCYISFGLIESSKIRVDTAKAGTFSIGDNFIFQANVTMSDPITITPDNEEANCTYTLNSDKISKAQYELELQKDGSEFDCALPDKFLDPRGDAYDIFKMKGTINDGTSSNQPAVAIGERTLALASGPVKLSDYMSYYSAINYSGSDLISLSSIYNMIIVTDNYYTFDSLDLYLSLPKLQEMKASGEQNFTDFTEAIYSYSKVEQKISQGDTMIKQCPKAVISKTEEGSALFICHSGNTNFAVGENLQIAGNMILTEDKAAITDATGIAGECYCYNYTKGVEMTCDDFDGTHL